MGGGKAGAVRRLPPAAETPAADGDADDPAIWIHPTDPSQSLVVGTDKERGLGVYDLAGQEIQFVAGGTPNNVDLQEGFPLSGSTASIVVAADDDASELRVYVVDVASRNLVDVAARPIRTGVEAHGLCLYHSSRSGRFHAFTTEEGGRIEQWELLDAGSGKVDARRVRGPWDVGAQIEGCVADDEAGTLYVGAEEAGIFAYGAEPGDPLSRTEVAAAGAGGHLVPDVEGLAILRRDGGDLLLASSQGDNSFVAYRIGGGHDFVGRFRVASGEIDGCEDTDGIEVVNRSLGPRFPGGLFVCQDGARRGGGTNFKLVPLERVTAALEGPPAPQGTADGETLSAPEVSPDLVDRAREAVERLLVDGIIEIERELGGTVRYAVQMSGPAGEIEVELDEGFRPIPPDGPPHADADVTRAIEAARILSDLPDVFGVEREEPEPGQPLYIVEFLHPDGGTLALRFNERLRVMEAEIDY